MGRVKDYFQNERGNIALFVIGSLALMMVLFVFIMNMGSVLATKEKSGTTSKQASLAATSTVYEEVRKAIWKYYDETDWGEGEDEDEDDEDDPVKEFFEKFDENIQKKKQTYYWWSHPGWSDNELELKAMSEVIDNGLTTPILKTILRSILSNPSIGNSAINKAKNVISKNGGTLTGAEMKIENNQIQITAANEFKSTSYDQFLAGIKEDVYQTSRGPEISFLHVVFDGSPTIKLD